LSFSLSENQKWDFGILGLWDILNFKQINGKNLHRLLPFAYNNYKTINVSCSKGSENIPFNIVG
jgi:hypothetical protein